MLKFIRSAVLIFTIGLNLGCTPHGNQSDQVKTDNSFTGSTRVGIIGGERLKNDDPLSQSTVFVFQYVKSSGMVYSQCTGSLIGSNFVMTAAHCLSEDDFKSQYGDSETAAYSIGFLKEAELDIDGRSLTQITDFRVHEHFIGFSTDPCVSLLPANDIALMKFSDPIPVTYAPASILRTSSPSESFLNGARIALAGFGPPNHAETTMTLRLLFSSYDSSIQSKPDQITLQDVPGHRLTEGDSGGPAAIWRGDKWIVFGVNSNGCTGGVDHLESTVRQSDWLAKAASQMGASIAP